jgi:hypothetical protein
MKLARICALVAVPVALAACGSDDRTTDDVAIAPATPTMDAGRPAAPMNGAGMDMSVNMSPVGNSGVTGQATVTAMGSDTQLMVTLNAPAGGTTHQGHVHEGTCDSPGAVVQALDPITLDGSGNGSMTRTVQIDSNTVMNGRHIIAYHEAGGNPGAPIVCGAIPMHSM